MLVKTTVIAGMLSLCTALMPALEVLDIATVELADGSIGRFGGAAGTGTFGVPVAGGADIDGDGHQDMAIAHFNSNPLNRPRAGQVSLIFGDGTIGGEFNTAPLSPRLIRVLGAVDGEVTGSEIWIDDVTGDGLGDLLICRQNYTPEPGREGAGGLTILVGEERLRDFAMTGDRVDLGNPTDEVTLVTIAGESKFDRLGIWVRTGDIDGDGIADIALGIDQRNSHGTSNSGALAVIRGGEHLLATNEFHMGALAGTALEGNVRMLLPPEGSFNYHMGATCAIGDLDGDDRGEVFAAATLNRSGAGLRHPDATSTDSQSSGGTPDGTLYIAWDENFPLIPWPLSPETVITELASGHSAISGAPFNRNFGEEIIPGIDVDGNGELDLFVGDLTGDGTSLLNLPARAVAGVGHVIFNAANLRDVTARVDQLPGSMPTTTILGPRARAISSDTAAHADFDEDGIDDLCIGNPTDSPDGRAQAGTVHIFLGGRVDWQPVIDLSPSALAVSGEGIIEIRGAVGQAGINSGDMLCYSAATGDVDGDGATDILINEMAGDGLSPGLTDVGNMLVISGRHFFDSTGLLVH